MRGKRRLALPREIGNWSLTSLQQRLVKTGSRLIKHTRYYWLLLAESYLTRRLFGGMLGKVAVLLSSPGVGVTGVADFGYSGGRVEDAAVGQTMFYRFARR